MSNSNTKLLQRVELILDIARRMAEKQDKEIGGYSIQNRIEEIQVNTCGYAEPGYDTATGIVILSNWNNAQKWNDTTRQWETVSNLPSRLYEIFEKMGIDCDWSDEYSDCSECGKLFRTSGDSYHWQPSYVLGDGEILCHECIENDPEAHLENLEGNPNRCNTISSIDPADHGYVCVQEKLESGWHEHMTADPKKIAVELKAKGITRFLFSLDENSQFYSVWSVYIAEEQMSLFNGEQEEDDTEEDEDEQS